MSVRRQCRDLAISVLSACGSSKPENIYQRPTAIEIACVTDQSAQHTPNGSKVLEWPVIVLEKALYGSPQDFLISSRSQISLKTNFVLGMEMLKVFEVNCRGSGHDNIMLATDHGRAYMRAESYTATLKFIMRLYSTVVYPLQKAGE